MFNVNNIILGVMIGPPFAFLTNILSGGTILTGLISAAVAIILIPILFMILEFIASKIEIRIK